MNSAITFDGSFYTPLTYGQSGVSNDSNALKGLMDNLREHLLQSQTFTRRVEISNSSLQEMLVECNQENWDGYGALPINFTTFSEAKKLLDGLPSTIPVPDISPEPSGAIALEWYKDARNVFSISVDGNSRIIFAGLFGHDELHGTSYFSETLPEIIVTNINRVFS